MDNRKFIIECEVPVRWVDDFCSFLKYLERCGGIGHSACVGFYADGDGDFRPKFNIITDYNILHGCTKQWIPEVTFDAG